MIGRGLVAVVVLITVVIGCGTGSDTTEATLTKAQFIKRGDKICETAHQAKDKAIKTWMQEEVKKGKTVEDFSEEELGEVYRALALPPIKDASSELAALPLPKGDVKAEKLVESLGSAVRKIAKNPTQALKGTPYADADRIAAAYGFKSCDKF